MPPSLFAQPPSARATVAAHKTTFQASTPWDTFERQDEVLLLATATGREIAAALFRFYGSFA
jgi:hypothetical protein